MTTRPVLLAVDFEPEVLQILPLHEQSMFKPMLERATIDSERMWRITCNHLLAFFR